MKKLVSLLLALLMVMGMATAFAEISDQVIPVEEYNYIMPLAADGSITVTNPVATNTYKAYKIFDVVYSATGGNYAYQIDSNTNPWFNAVSTYDQNNESITLTQVEGSTVYIVTAADFNAANFAAFLYGYVDGEADPADIVDEKVKELTYTDNGAAVIGELDHGYYFVTSTLGSLCSLTTTDPDVEIREKNEAPEVQKEVKEDSTGKWGETNDAEIGETVEFKATITAKAGAEGYVLHDKMSAGLTLEADSIKVMVGDDELEAANYTITTEGLDDGCTFEISFTPAYLDTIVADTAIVVTYSAVVNENAVIAGEGNPNEVKLGYGDESNVQTTPPDTTITYVWDMDVEKFAYTDDAKTTTVNLEGATFVLKQVVDEAEVVVKMTQVESTTTYKVDPEGTVTEITTDASGKFTVSGLDSGTYYLYETAAPTGYNILTAPIKVVVGTDGKLTIDDAETSTDTVKVENTSGHKLPSTGGMGTTLLYAVGGVLMLVAFVLIVSKRRASEN